MLKSFFEYILVSAKHRLRSAKNVVFFLFCILVGRPMGGGGGGEGAIGTRRRPSNEQTHRDKMMQGIRQSSRIFRSLFLEKYFSFWGILVCCVRCRRKDDQQKLISIRGSICFYSESEITQVPESDLGFKSIY